ncbi:MAG: Zn-dependent hydrolase [Acidimicrobiales bacterium]
MSDHLEADLGRLSDDLETLSSFRDPEHPGWTRPVFSPVDREARLWVAETMRAAGLEVETDSAANLIGRLAGSGEGGGAVVTGSHTDTVLGGGRFDGIIGVLGAIEAARCLRESGVSLEHDLVVIDFLGEEPNDFGLSCVGSRAIAGNLSGGHLALGGPDGDSLACALEKAGGDPAAVAGARWALGSVHCFIELHIEQGPRLERAGKPIGVVTGIAGIHRLAAEFTGRPDHAGTTPMRERRDALLGAAEAALEIEAAAEGGVATAGRLEVRPGANNVVPGEATLWAEARSDDEEWLAGFARRVESSVAGIAKRRRLESALRWASREGPVLVTAWVADAISQAARSFGTEPLELPSGAGHDAAQMAAVGPMGMIFVPSHDGRSHCPEEWTELDQIGHGVTVLIEALGLVDGISPPAWPAGAAR